MTNNTGLFGFGSCQPVIKKGYNKKATDKILQRHRQNAETYRERIRELDEELDLVTRQRDATRKAYLNYLENHGIKLDEDEFDQYFEECMNEM
ncbi:hypothetical protein [Pseudodesulfovibrio methanolicus]|uniref:Uncharacterized protein n=1 Tax=Pseudodesulfovibrio methanolicus TaxID=3126690 RepID=A0ABZ2IXJ9_9BACT